MIEKIRIRLKGKDVYKYFDYYQWLGLDCSDLFYPKNKDIIEFIKYISGWGNWVSDYYFTGHKTDFITEEIPDFVKPKLKKENLQYYVFVEFEFPDEETAFFLS